MCFQSSVLGKQTLTAIWKEERLAAGSPSQESGHKHKLGNGCEKWLEEESLAEGRRCKKSGRFLGEQNEYFFFFRQSRDIRNLSRQKVWFRNIWAVICTQLDTLREHLNVKGGQADLLSTYYVLDTGIFRFTLKIACQTSFSLHSPITQTSINTTQPGTVHKPLVPIGSSAWGALLLPHLSAILFFILHSSTHTLPLFTIKLPLPFPQVIGYAFARVLFYKSV